MTLQNKAYDKLKFVALVLLPALSAGYFSLAQIWHLPRAEEVVGTITILDTVLGLLLKSSSTVHQKVEQEAEKTVDGALVVTDDPEDGTRYLALHVSREVMNDLENRNTVKLAVSPASSNT